MDEKKVALISGGTSGIGFACARILVSKGWYVAINGRDQDKGNVAIRKLAAGDKVTYIAGDVASEQACQLMVANALEHFGQLDGLVTSAGFYGEGLIDDVCEDDVKEMFATNVYGTMFLCKYALPALRQRQGAIVTIGSDAGMQGNIACSVYGATKGAIVAFSKSLALEEAPHGVRVNCICPGDVQTPLLEQQMKANPALSVEAIKEQYPLYRIAEPGEIANVIAFLLGKEASYVTAASWAVDGGLTSW